MPEEIIKTWDKVIVTDSKDMGTVIGIAEDKLHAHVKFDGSNVISTIPIHRLKKYGHLNFEEIGSILNAIKKHKGDNQ